jgi:5'-nucleotidase
VLPAALLVATVSGGQGRGRNGAAVTVQLLAINDFHGNLEPPSGANGRIGNTPAGGAEYLATHLKNDIVQNPNSIVVAAGDLIGASPLISALFHDEPTVEAMSAMGLAISSVGNHEFDHGAKQLLRLQKGGCDPADGCRDGDGFAGASFRYLSANVVGKQDQKSVTTLFPPIAVRTIGGVKIGFIGETLQGTPQIVTPTGVQGLTFLDEAATANRYAAQLKQQGVNAIVLLIHQGGNQDTDAQPNDCRDFRGALVPIIQRLSADIKVIASGHTHRFYNCTIAGHLVTSASSFGRMITRITLTIDPSTDTITSVAATNDIVTRDVSKDPAQSRILAKYGPLSASIANRVLGSVTGEITRTANAAGESALGDLIADAQLAATSPAVKGGAVVAFMNAGGIRADLSPDGHTGDTEARPVTYRDLFTIQPFNDVITVMTLTGDMVKQALERQFDDPSSRLLQVSKGFAYSYRLSAPSGQRVDPTSIRINGRVVSPSEKVRVAVPDILADGALFKQGTNRLGGDVDIDALVAYFKSQSPVSAGQQNRITRID